MFLQRIASALVFFAGLVLLRFSVVWESWAALALGIAIATVGLIWLILGGSDTAPDETPTRSWTPQRHA